MTVRNLPIAGFVSPATEDGANASSLNTRYLRDLLASAWSRDATTGPSPTLMPGAAVGRSSASELPASLLASSADRPLAGAADRLLPLPDGAVFFSALGIASYFSRAPPDGGTPRSPPVGRRGSSTSFATHYRRMDPPETARPANVGDPAAGQYPHPVHQFSARFRSFIRSSRLTTTRMAPGGSGLYGGNSRARGPTSSPPCTPSIRSVRASSLSHEALDGLDCSGEKRTASAARFSRRLMKRGAAGFVSDCPGSTARRSRRCLFIVLRLRLRPRNSCTITRRRQRALGCGESRSYLGHHCRRQRRRVVIPRHVAYDVAARQKTSNSSMSSPRRSNGSPARDLPTRRETLAAYQGGGKTAKSKSRLRQRRLAAAARYVTLPPEAASATDPIGPLPSSTCRSHGARRPAGRYRHAWSTHTLTRAPPRSRQTASTAEERPNPRP